MAAGLRTAVLGLLLAGVLTLTACGGGDSSSTATSTATQAATTGSDSATFCDAFASVSDDIGIDMDPTDPALADRLTKAADALKAVQPPAEIADDWNTLVTFYEQFGQAFANATGDDGASLDKVGEAITKLQSNAKELASASANVGRYTMEHC